MTLQELINWFSANQYIVLGYFSVLFILTLIIVAAVTHNNFKQLRYVMSFIVYGVTVPGILALFLTLYAILFLNTSLLNVSVVAYFVPIATMIVTLIVLNKKVKMQDIPGFGKLSALMIMISISFFAIFVLQKSYFGVFFIGGIGKLLAIFAVLMLVLKISWSKLSK